MSTPELVLCRGLPASGKSTFAKAWVLESPENRARVNRDSFRTMMHVEVANTTQHSEALITRLSQEAVRSYLKAGVSVVVDDTNLNQRVAREWATIAHKAGADFTVQDFTHVPLEECHRRNELRESGVPAEVIDRMHSRYLAKLKGDPRRTLPYPTPRVEEPEEVGPVEHYPGKPNAVIVDIDGTLAECGDRDIYDEARAYLDSVHWDVLLAATAVANDRHGEIIVMSGRSDEHRSVTVDWLHDAFYGVSPYNGPFMRKAGDQRKDSIVKRELFDEHVRGKYNVVAVFDDRSSVVRLWRDLGLRCYQVAEGDF